MKFTGNIPIICGPTGSGKTAVALEIAREIPIEIVSADSGQMIRNFNIGTAKPTPEEQEQVRFHLIDILDPGQEYSSFRFIEDADRAISDILSRNKLSVVVGGTGLYLRALTEGVFEIESDNLQIRAQLEKEMEQVGAEAMHNRLKSVDPEEASKIHFNNKIRVTRALAIYHLTGLSKSELAKSGRHKKSQFEYQFFCFIPPRAELYESINRRVDKMIENGLVDEINGFIEAGMTKLVQKMSVIGYSELLEHIIGNITLEQAVLLIKQNSRHYAKRQITWFRNQTEGAFFSDKNELKNAFLAQYQRFVRESRNKT